MNGDASGRIRIACAQLIARNLSQAERSLEEALIAIAEAARMGADLVVLPECTYPAYVLAEEVHVPPLLPDAEVEATFATAARENHIAVAVGLAQGFRLGGREARNAALLFDASGAVRMRSAKRFLWDFDRRWFQPGNPATPVDFAGTSVGALVCADLRQPEICRSLAVAGARLILDPTAWVTVGRHRSTLSNPQPEFLVAVRAMENGAYLAAASKVGVERHSVVYCGRSGVWAPTGDPLVMAGSEEPEVVIAEADLSVATGPPVARRPDLYRMLVEASSRLPVHERAGRPIVPTGSNLRLALLQEDRGLRASELVAEATRYRAIVEAMGVGLLAATCSEGEARRSAWGASARDVAATVSQALGIPSAVAAVDGGGNVIEAAMAGGGQSIHARPSHGEEALPDETLESRCFDLGEVRVGLIVGREGLVPEVPRILLLEGAELILWFPDRGTPDAKPVARARALENRMYTALVKPPGDEPGLVLLADPDGRVVATGLANSRQLVLGMVSPAIARAKEMVPGTDVVADRQPATYEPLVRLPTRENPVL